MTWNHPVDAAILGTPVPTLILQPLVENAVVHAVAPRREGGSIEITIGKDAQKHAIHLEVRDDGPGIAPEKLATLLDEPRPDSAPEPGRANARAGDSVYPRNSFAGPEPS